MRILVERILEEGEQIPPDLSVVSAVRQMHTIMVPDERASDRTRATSRWLWHVVGITEVP